MFERRIYQTARLDGDYAYLIEVDENSGVFISGEEKCVARALLPASISEGTRLIYEMMEYSILE